MPRSDTSSTSYESGSRVTERAWLRQHASKPCARVGSLHGRGARSGHASRDPIGQGQRRRVAANEQDALVAESAHRAIDRVQTLTQVAVRLGLHTRLTL